MGTTNIQLHNVHVQVYEGICKCNTLFINVRVSNKHVMLHIHAYTQN